MAKTNAPAASTKSAAPAASTKSAAPGAATDKAAKPRKPVPAKIPFRADDAPLLKHDDPTLATYTRKIHKALKPSDFESKPEAMRFQAVLFERQAARIRKDAETYEKMGAIVDNKKAKRLLALQKQMEALKSSLVADGQDISELLKSMGISLPDATPAPAAE